MNILLAYPRNPEGFWSFRHVLPFVAKKSAFPPLGLLTVAAMLPRGWNVRLVDLNVRSLADEDIAWADTVFLSGMIVHRDSAHEVAGRCAALGRTVIAGGPLFTTGHAGFPEIRHFVLGEAESVMPELVSDLERGTLRRIYRASVWPDVRTSPVPRWDLIDLRDYVTMPVQFSRGCPFNCEFCDIIEVYGRKPRTKTPEQLLRELDRLRALGYKGHIDFVDDNFIANPAAALGLVRELVDWQQRRGYPVQFACEATLNLAKHTLKSRERLAQPAGDTYFKRMAQSIRLLAGTQMMPEQYRRLTGLSGASGDNEIEAREPVCAELVAAGEAVDKKVRFATGGNLCPAECDRAQGSLFPVAQLDGLVFHNGASSRRTTK